MPAKKIRINTDDGPTEVRAKTFADSFPGPNQYAGIPQTTGVGQFDDNAKAAQRAGDRPKSILNKIKGHISVNEMQDQADDNTNFLGYCNDN